MSTVLPHHAVTSQPRRDGRRTLCAAEGILVALRQCDLDDAFVEIVRTARQHNVAPLRLAKALIAAAQGESSAVDGSVIDIVDAQWGSLLGADHPRRSSPAY